MRHDAVTLYIGMICVLASLAQAEEIRVADTIELRAILAHVAPGMTVLLSPGVYQGGLYVSDLAGTQGAPIVIQGADPNAPPVFRGSGGQAFHLADCSHVVLRNIQVEGYAGNGINIDDGGSFETPSHHITLENITILETGPAGRHCRFRNRTASISQRSAPNRTDGFRLQPKTVAFRGAA
ncbi:MAG TPA: hypothetical protein VLI39_15270 [Sedimentisphaerales bacterium]|nr:hypothetical protein [Sedimentisphaerales bacterium]